MEYLKRLDPQSRRWAKLVGDLADQKGLFAYLVGGIVRDLMLNRKNLDLDIVVRKDGLLLAEEFARASGGRLTVFAQFKTATVQLRDGHTVDFATARKETYAYSGALPLVSPGSLKEDLFRRDFSINAMAMCLNAQRFGDLMDFFGGREDLRLRKVRVLHDKSFEDDPTRILRAVRFEQRLGFQLEGKTFELLKEALKSNVIKNVKSPRFFEEFRKILKEEKFSRILIKLKGLKALDFLGPRLALDGKLLSSLEAKVARLKKLSFSCFQVEWGLLVFLAVVKGLKKADIDALVEKFQLSQYEERVLMQGLEFSKVEKALASKAAIERSEVYRLLKAYYIEPVLFCYCASSHERVQKRIMAYLQKDLDTGLKINGHDLEQLGLKEGKAVGEILRKVLNQKIDGKIKTRQQELALAKELIGI